jgi:hypothetical protein
MIPSFPGWFFKYVHATFPNLILALATLLPGVGVNLQAKICFIYIYIVEPLRPGGHPGIEWSQDDL